MSVSSTSAAAEREEREDIVGVGRREKSFIQESLSESSRTKPGSMVGKYVVGLKGGDQKIDSAAWSEPKELSKEIVIGEKQPVTRAESLSRNKLRTESRSFLLSEWVPFLVAAPAGLASKRSDSSNHSSRGAAQLNTVTPGRDQVEECMLKSPTTSVGVAGSRGWGSIWDKVGLWSQTEW